MDPLLLQQFRQQLASWIEARLESQRLPYQRLELCPATLTDLGPLIPDLVLWINRDSLLAGSLILLPDVVDDQTLIEGASLCKALSLGHFTTWAAREVSIWLVVSGRASLHHSFPLPPANRVTPEDFQNTLDKLLEALKIVTVTSTPPTSSFSVHYFANLCLRNLKELTPGLTVSTRISAGETAADAWVEHAPREKAWMSLWRVLFLLWQGRLPPGLQPERLELAIRYALTELISDQLSWLEIRDSEPPLPEDVAVRLHHLASRLRQLGWPHDDQCAHDLLCLLLGEAAHSFNLRSHTLPWCTKKAKLSVACQPTPSDNGCSLVAPRAYLAGWVVKKAMENHSEDSIYTETLQTIGTAHHFTTAIAVLQNTQALTRKERDDRFIYSRQVWPSRRFELPRQTPSWLWDAIYLAGLVSEELTLILPRGWHNVPGIMSLWELLAERYQMTAIAECESGEQALHLVQMTTEETSVRVHRHDLTIDLSPARLTAQKPGTTQVWLKAGAEIVELISSQRLTGAPSFWQEETEKLTWGLYVFLHTCLGRYLWELCSDQTVLPEFIMTKDAVLTFGVPIPSESVLLDLSMIGTQGEGAFPAQEIIEHEFSSIFGPVPFLPGTTMEITTGLPKIRRRGNAPAEQIKTQVFQDGIPRFPEHYLMHVYRPALIQYELKGPLEVAEEFFEQISLRTIGQEHTIEVSGRIVAKALQLASYSGAASVALPEDENLLEQLVLQYQVDLERLWDNLIRECRRFEPYRQTAIKLARKIWQEHGLPPASVHRRGNSQAEHH